MPNFCLTFLFNRINQSRVKIFPLDWCQRIASHFPLYCISLNKSVWSVYLWLVLACSLISVYQDHSTVSMRHLVTVRLVGAFIILLEILQATSSMLLLNFWHVSLTCKTWLVVMCEMVWHSVNRNASTSCATPWDQLGCFFHP